MSVNWEEMGLSREEFEEIIGYTLEELDAMDEKQRNKTLDDIFRELEDEIKKREDSENKIKELEKKKEELEKKKEELEEKQEIRKEQLKNIRELRYIISRLWCDITSIDWRIKNETSEDGYFDVEGIYRDVGDVGYERDGREIEKRIWEFYQERKEVEGKLKVYLNYYMNALGDKRMIYSNKFERVVTSEEFSRRMISIDEMIELIVF